MPVKSAISFGLVHIPVSLHPAAAGADIGFNQLHAADGERIRYKKVCSGCGAEVKLSEIVRGYEYEKDKYVVISDSDLEKIKTEKDKNIRILHFAAPNAVTPEFLEKTYRLLPEKGGERAFELLRKAMLALEKIGVAKTVLGEKETLIALTAHDGGIYAQTLFFAEEIKPAPKNYAAPEPKAEEMAVAKQLIGAMQANFEPEGYKNEYREKLRALLEAKINGTELEMQPERAKKTSADLMEALKMSLKQNEKPEKTVEKPVKNAEKAAKNTEKAAKNSEKTAKKPSKIAKIPPSKPAPHRRSPRTHG